MIAIYSKNAYNSRRSVYGNNCDNGITMTDNTYNKVKKYIDDHQMVEPGDLIAVGVSGGADSVCLLHVMWRLSKEIPCKLIAVHVDHGVRAESAEDAVYVERLCAGMGIPFYLKKVDMNGYAAEHGMSSEEAGRQLRYDAFEEALGRQERGTGGGKIAVAHNANDRAETMLFHLFRGSGIKGLSSIPPIRETVIRPLLCLEREEIERYLAERQLDYRHDGTNDEDLYTRNRIRHHILPYAGQEICSGTVMHMGALADMLSETERYLEKQTERLYAAYVEEVLPDTPEGTVSGIMSPDAMIWAGKPVCLRVQGAGLLSEDPVMCKRVLLLCLERMTPHRKDITGQHIADLVKLLVKEGCGEVCLPYGIRAYKEYDYLLLCRKADGDIRRNEGEKTQKQMYMVVPPTEISIPGEGEYSFTLLKNKDIFCEKQENIPENRYTKWFDYDKITTALFLRTRRTGDYLTIDAALHTKSLKQYMINEKIPRLQRDSMYLLVDGSHVLWVPGYRISERYKVDESTKRILRVQLRGGSHGRTNRSVID